ncbi:MAG: hypothetical protein ACAI44_33455 [Candidatus Sericytochromatia bacterium]
MRSLSSNPDFQSAFNRAFDFVKLKHAGQYHANHLPVWHHLARVSERLTQLLELHQEGDSEQRALISLAALGHDLFEDTDVAEEDVIAVFGPDGYRLIAGMTNEHGDESIEPYVQKMAQEPEAVRLIKLADLCDNVTSVTYNLISLGPRWAREFFLPIVHPMIEMILSAEFTLYARSAQELKSYLRASYALLELEYHFFSQLEE